MAKSSTDEHCTRVRSKNSSGEAIEKRRNLCGIVKKPKGRFRFTANLPKRDEADAMRRTHQVILSCINLSCMVREKWRNLCGIVKNSSREAIERWRNLCGKVKNFRFTANLPKRDEADAMRRRTNQQLLDFDSGDIGNVSKENEAGQAPFPSASPSTYPSNCSLEDQRSSMDESILEANMEIQEEEMKKDYENHFRRLEPKKRDVGGDGSINESKNEEIEASNPNNCSFNRLTDEEFEAWYVESSQAINDESFQLHHPTVQLSPQVPSSVPVVHMPLPVNHFNQQQIITQPTIPIASMPMTAGLVPNWLQPDHMSPVMTGLQEIPSSNPFHHIPHHSTPLNHVVHPIPPTTHRYNPQILSNGVPYYQQPHHHELPPPMTSPEFSSNGQHFVNHQPYSELEAPIDVHTGIIKGKHWSEDEHRLFLLGMDIFGKGNWKDISIYVFGNTRTPSQIASHAQKYFNRQEKNKQNNNNNNNKTGKRKRESILDITDPYSGDFAKPSHH